MFCLVNRFRCHKECEKRSPQQCVVPMFLVGVSPSISTTTTATADSSTGSNVSSTMPSPALTTHHLHAPGNNNASSSNLSTVSSNESTNGSSTRINGVGRGIVNIFRNIINAEGTNASYGTVPSTKQTTRQPPTGLNLDPQIHSNHLGKKSIFK